MIKIKVIVMSVSFRKAFRLIVIASLCFFSLQVSANSDPSEQLENEEPETIVVVGKATNTVVTTEQLESYQANDLADIFRSTPSISVGGSLGIAQKIYLRGVEDSLINVTVDGAPQTSTLFHHIGRVTIDPSLLQKIEVQAGAGEATSGPGAIGGAIRFKTKNASDLLENGKAFGGLVKLNSFSNDGSQYSASLYGSINDNWGVLGYFNSVERNNMTDGNGDAILGSSSDQKIGLLKVNGEISENQKLSLSYERRDEEGLFTDKPNWVVRAKNKLYRSEANRETFVANYKFNNSDMLNLELTGYQTDSSFRGGRFDYLAEIKSVGFDFRNTSNINRHRLVYGVDYRNDQVDSGYAIPKPEEDHREKGSVLGIYAQIHTQLSESLLLSYGARYDDYHYQQKILLPDYYGEPIAEKPAEIDLSGVSLNAGFEYQISNQLTFGLGYAEALRGKEIGDGFTLDAYLYDKTTAGIVDPNLKEETVSNIEASLEYAKDKFRAKLAIFNSEIDDAIYERQYGNSFYQNIGAIESKGLEFNMAYYWDSLELSLGFASNDSELKPASGLYKTNFNSVPINGYEFSGLGNSRGDSWNLGLNYAATSTVSLGLNYSYVSQLTIDALHQDVDLGWVSELYSLNKPSYQILDVFAEWKLNDSLTFNFSIANAFDELYRNHSSVGDFSAVPDYGIVVGPWEAGRDVRLSISFKF